MLKLGLSLATVASVVLVTFSSSVSFFSDTQTSPHNMLSAGDFELQVGFAGYFNQEPGGAPNAGSFPLKDLTEQDILLDFPNLTPGDFGSAQVILRTTSNAWGAIKLQGQEEFLGADPQDLKFFVWLDQGSEPGFQGTQSDLEEADGVWQPENEPLLIMDGVSLPSSQFILSQALSQAYTDGKCTNETADTSGQECHGLNSSGQMLADTDYHLGWFFQLSQDAEDPIGSWFLGNITFQAIDATNNPTMPFTSNVTNP